MCNAPVSAGGSGGLAAAGPSLQTALQPSPCEERSPHAPAGCHPVNKEPSLTLAGILLYHAKVSSASSMAFPSSSSSWERVLFLWRCGSWLDPTFSAAQPLTGAAPALG